MNCAILMDMLDEEYEIIETKDGLQGVGLLQQRGVEISLVLLDIAISRIDGFGILNVMSQNRWIKDIPVIMISAETGSSHIIVEFRNGESGLYVLNGRILMGVML